VTPASRSGVVLAASLAALLLLAAVRGAPPTTVLGFGAGTTGGQGGTTVRVTTAEALKHELCRSLAADGRCSDQEPRIIELVGMVDYTGSEGVSSAAGCVFGNACPAPLSTETLVLLGPDDTHCEGRAIREIAFDKAGNRPLLVGSNKTLIGIGADAVIKGKGLALKGVSNVVIRNLTISQINPGVVFAGDAVVMDGVDRVWIDHNRFRDIGRQMITGGYGPTTHVTISWNDFDGATTHSHYCNGTHYWNLLLLGTSQSVTLSQNWFHDFSGRAPKIDGQALVQVVGNYFQHGTGHALDAADAAKVLVEGNDFEDVKLPINVTDHGGAIFAARGDVDAAAQARCRAALGRACAGNRVAPAAKVDGFDLKDAVLDAFKQAGRAQLVTPAAISDVRTMVTQQAGPGHL
jgi:pectin lyase